MSGDRMQLRGKQGGHTGLAPAPQQVRRWAWMLMTAAALTVAVLNSRFMWMDIRTIFERAIDHLGKQDFELYLHLYTAPAILVVGALLFPKRLRTRFPKVHRWAGRVYIVTILVTSIATLRLALTDSGGLLTIFGFSVLSILWFGTAAMAWLRAMQGRLDDHGQWMIRNYALTLTNVTFRAELHVALMSGAQFLTVYEPLRVLQWIPNLLIAEMLIRGRFFTSNSWAVMFRARGAPVAGSGFQRQA